MVLSEKSRLQVDGKFFSYDGKRIEIRAVTYGPFPGGMPTSIANDFIRIRKLGFNAIRLFEMPSINLLDEAGHVGLLVFAGLPWCYGMNFIAEPRYLSEAQTLLSNSLREASDHPALVGVFVANEIPADMVRFMSSQKVREAIESLISLARNCSPHLLFAYANYPSTEYLEPENADFTAFNLYLEDESACQKYLRRLHHLAGDRPLMISEFGLDSQHHGLAKQSDVLRWGINAMQEAHVAGLAIYAWSDRWFNGGYEVLDWDFGITNREGVEKPSAKMIQKVLGQEKIIQRMPLFSVIVCTRNGASRIDSCLKAITKINGYFEIIVVDDGSIDQATKIVVENFPQVNLISIQPSGLSAARNAGAKIARGTYLAFTDDDCEPDQDWLIHLYKEFQRGEWAAVGGPNLSPNPQGIYEAIIAAADGAPTHVMLDDYEAEHLPGCNFAVKVEVFNEIGGFDKQFHTAGDDVDFCWRLSVAGYHLGFAPTAFVWHHRRSTIVSYIRQQFGYGKAEALLVQKYPHKFHHNSGAIWAGFVYQGGVMRSVTSSIIYHGVMGCGGYQMGVSGMLIKRLIHQQFRNLWSEKFCILLSKVTAYIRKITRIVLSENTDLTKSPRIKKKLRYAKKYTDDFSLVNPEGLSRWDFLNKLQQQGWRPADDKAEFDLIKKDLTLLIAIEQSSSITNRTWFRLSADTILSLNAEINKLRKKLVFHN
jgi:glycosyltransferase involved in cell wall biosynthesis